MTKADIVKSDTTEPQDEKGQDHVVSHVLDKDQERQILEEIILLDTRLESLYYDYTVMTESLEGKSQTSIPEQSVQKGDLKPWYKRAALKLARAAVNRPEYKPRQITSIHLSLAEKSNIATEALGIQNQIETLTKRRDELMAQLDHPAREKIEQKSNVIHIRDYVARKSQRIVELASKIEGGEIATGLEQLTEGRYLSIEKMNEVLKALPGVKVEIPEHEMARLKALSPKELTPETLQRIKKLKEQTEGDRGPVAMQLPQKVTVDGVERDFTIQTMYDIMQKVQQADSSYKPMWLGSYVKAETKSQKWPSELTVWTSACLKGSKSKEYDAQLKHQEKILGKGHEIDADMILAMTLRYLASGKSEELMRTDFMRLNARDTDGDPLDVRSGGDDLRLYSSYRDASSDGGLGASVRISS